MTRFRKHGPDPSLWPQPAKQGLTWIEWAKRLNAEAARRGWNPEKWPWDDEDYHSVSCWIEDWTHGKTPEQTADEHHQSQTTRNRTTNYFPTPFEPTPQDLWIAKHGKEPTNWPLPEGQKLAWEPWMSALIEEGLRRGFHPDFLVQELIFDCWGLHWLAGLTPTDSAAEMAKSGEIFA